MISAVEPFGLGIAEWALVAAAVVGALEVLGVSRSSRTVRKANSDYREHNAILQGEVDTRDERIVTLELKTQTLERLIDDLKARSVDSLFAQFHEHDTMVSAAWQDVAGSMARMVENIDVHEGQAQSRHAAMMEVMERIATFTNPRQRRT